MLETAQDERDRILKIQKGDVNAFSDFFMSYYETLYQFALKYTKDPTLAEDAVQQVFCKIWEKRSRLSTVVNFEQYIKRAIKNELIDAIRKNIVARKYLQELALKAEPVRTPIEKIDSKKRTEIIDQAITNLSPQQRRVYLLSKNEGRSYEQIASEMKISIHTVKWHAAAAFQSLSVYLRRHEKELFIFLLIFWH